MRAPKGEGAATLDDLVEHAAGLVCLTGGAGRARWPRAVAGGDREARGRSSSGWRHLRPLQRLRRAAAPLSPRPGGAATTGCARGRAALGLPLARHQCAAARRRARTGRCSTSSRASASTPTLDAAGRLLAQNSERFMKSGRGDGAALRRLPRRGGQQRRAGAAARLHAEGPRLPLPRVSAAAGARRPSATCATLAEAGARARYGDGARSPSGRAGRSRTSWT